MVKAKVAKVLLVLSVLVFLSGCPGLLQKSFTLTMNTEGEGSVERAPDAEEYARGEEVELTAVPSDGWEFSHWSGDLTGSENPETILMDEDKEITAHFVQSMLGNWLGEMECDALDFAFDVGLFITKQTNETFSGVLIFYFDPTIHLMAKEQHFMPLGFGQVFDFSGRIDPDNSVVMSIVEYEEREQGALKREYYLEIRFEGTLDEGTISGEIEIHEMEKRDGTITYEFHTEGTLMATRKEEITIPGDLVGTWLGEMTNETDDDLEKIDIGIHITEQENGDFSGVLAFYIGIMSTAEKTLFNPLDFGMGFDITGSLDVTGELVISVSATREEYWYGKKFEYILEIELRGSVVGDSMSGNFEWREIEKEDGSIIYEDVIEGTWNASRN